MNQGAWVLAVEDDARNAALLRAALVPAGYRLTVVPSLAEARSRLTDELPDLVLLDIGLPDGSGLELARELRASASTANIPIIVSSARVLAADRAAAHEAGCDAFLAKPISLSELLSTVALYVA
ncbi:MAG TPA: response regulator [Candidatus Limnocylindria bacterium]|nr:response regulator [Candidatus Limnocylindria bacterium]